MAGTRQRRCDNPICRRIVMVSDRGRVGDAFGSTVETDEHGVPHATCPSCQTVTPWPPRCEELTDSPATPLAGARLIRLAECIEAGSHLSTSRPVPTAASGRAVMVQQTCARCGTVYSEEGFV